MVHLIYLLSICVTPSHHTRVTMKAYLITKSKYLVAIREFVLCCIHSACCTCIEINIIVHKV